MRSEKKIKDELEMSEYRLKLALDQGEVLAEVTLKRNIKILKWVLNEDGDKDESM